jgi:hypothetical protein
MEFYILHDIIPLITWSQNSWLKNYIHPLKPRNSLLISSVPILRVVAVCSCEKCQGEEKYSDLVTAANKKVCLVTDVPLSVPESW